MFFNDHLFPIDFHFLCRCVFTTKRTHIHSPKEINHLVGGGSLYLSLLQNFWDGEIFGTVKFTTPFSGREQNIFTG